MNKASSNSNMTRSTAEALKQIQKQGLSISIVSADTSSRSPFPLDVSKETRPKQNVTNDKTPKILPRSSVTDIKSALSQARSVPVTTSETRTSVGQSVSQSSQSVFQESKMPGNINKSNTPVSSPQESRAFGSQSWNSPPSSSVTDNKTQGISTRSVQAASIVSENKNQSSSMTRLSQNLSLLSDNKIQSTRGGQNAAALHENKNQCRISQTSSASECKSQVNQGRSQNQVLTFEGKVAQATRMSLNSPPSEMKVLTNSQGRSNQNFSNSVHENKNNNSQRAHNQVLNDLLLNSQVKVVANRPVEVKTPTQTRGNPTVKGTNVDRIRQVVKNDNKPIVEQSSGSPTMSLDRTQTNPFRVASALTKKISNSAEEKSLVKFTKMTQNIAIVSENQTALHSKASQNMSMQTESKAVSQVVKISSISSDLSQKSAISLDNSPDRCITPGLNMSSRGATKRPPVSRLINTTPVLKKKCVKRPAPNTNEHSGQLQGNAETCTISSDEGTPTKEKEYFNIKGLTPGLTITPVALNSANPSTSGIQIQVPKKPVDGAVNAIVICPSCRNCSFNIKSCDSCHARIAPNTPQYQIGSNETIPSFVVTKNVTTSIEKKIVYQFPEMLGQNQSFRFKQAMQGQVMIEASPVIHVTPRGKGRPRTRRKFEEPVVYTLSSDEEEPVQFNPNLDEATPIESDMCPVESEGSKSEHSSNSDILQEDNQEFDEPEYPGVTDINPHLEEEPDDEIMDYEGGGIEEEEEECSLEEEEVEEEEEESLLDEEGEEEDRPGQKPTDYPLRCRSIRIGSYKVHPRINSQCVPVTLAADSISFQAPILTDPNKSVNIILRDQEIKSVLVHFGRCLPIMFIFTTSTFGEAVRNALNMSERDPRYFDPNSKDDKTQKLTFLIETLTEDQRTFLRYRFPGEKKIKEMDQKTANEILVKSTPNQNIAVKLHCNDTLGGLSVENQIAHSLNPSSQLSVTKVMLPQLPPQPVIKLFTYPPPPQTGGIAITNEDLACLNEGEFLNDAIIDFYLKYMFYEKLTPAQREKTHIFSSYFYPRLTHKPERQRPGEEVAKTMQVRRHNQVKTWTRHVDIFSKDFIIIPINQNVHWFLAIICYPARVLEATNDPVKTECKANKSNDNVSSSAEQQEDGNKPIIKELNSNSEVDSNQDENSMNSGPNSPYEVEEPPDSDEHSCEIPDSTTYPDGRQKQDLPCICIFDSLCGPNRWRIASTLREYLEMEWKMKKGTRKVFDRNTMQGFIMKCPQQTNYSDCGTYVLQYVESFFENPIPYFRPPMPDLTNWFSEAKISKKRQQLQELILALQKKLQTSTPGTGSRKSNQPDSPATVTQTENR